MPISNYGTLLQLGDGGSPETFTTVAEVVAIQPPAVEASFAETTPHDGVGWYDGIPTTLELKEFSVTINYEPATAQHAALITAVTAKTLSNYQIVFPDTTTWSFSAYTVAFEVDEADARGGADALRATVKFRPVVRNSAPTFA